jgi:septum formation inhibitor-activating ATPase MinD
MKIKVAVLDKDEHYLTRLMAALNNGFADKLEMYSFTVQDTALDALEKNKINVFLADEFFEIEQQAIPSRCGFIYLSGENGIASIRGIPAICKYQKADLIYKCVLNTYAERRDLSINGNQSKDGERLILFSAPCGGVGTSTSAAACALHLAKQGKKVLYLNLEQFGGADMFFQGEGQFTMSDLIYAIKRKNSNIQVKIEAILRQTEDGVRFISQSATALDMNELEIEEIKEIIAGAAECGFEYVVIDGDYSATNAFMELLNLADVFVTVTDGTMIGNAKMERGITALRLLSGQNADELMSKIFMIYNKCSNHCQVIDNLGTEVLGMIPRYKDASTEEIMRQIIGLGVFNKLLE